MMGQQGEDRAKLFYEFCLEDRVPVDHLLRKIDRFLDLRALRQELAPFYSTIGRPSIDPELMIRILVVGYCFGIRSERRLCEEVDLNLAYRWFCRLGLEDRVPDHTEPANPTVRRAPSRPNVVPDSRAARCREACMRRRARSPEASPARRSISSHAASG